MFDMQAQWDRPAHNGSRSEEHVLRVRLIPRAQSGAGLPLHLAIALDTSSSMEGRKIEQAKSACRAVLGLLRPQDRISVCTYSTGVSEIGCDIAAGSAEMASLDGNLSSVSASGVTRVDLALDWLRTVLANKSNGVACGVIVTDGHPTDPRGGLIADVSPFVTAAAGLFRMGVRLYTIGLGDAADFNTDFLREMGDRSGGGFLYAETPELLSPLLRDRLRVSQLAVSSSVSLRVAALLPGISLVSFCRLRPEYLPLESAGSPGGRNTQVELGTIRGDAPTDVLLRFEVPGQGVGASQGAHNALDLKVVTKSGASPRQTVSLKYTSSYAESQQINQEVDRDRLMWDTNAFSELLVATHDPNKTADLLSRIVHTATRAGLVQTASNASKNLTKLKASGRITKHDTTSILTNARGDTADS